MVTRAEQAKADTQRSNRSAKKVRAAAKGATKTAARGAGKAATRTPSARAGTARTGARAEKKATYALEAPSKAGRPSRKSTRASANRAKPSSPFDAREELQKGSATARYRKDEARAMRVRGRRTSSA